LYDDRGGFCPEITDEFINCGMRRSCALQQGAEVRDGRWFADGNAPAPVVMQIERVFRAFASKNRDASLVAPSHGG